MKNILLSVSVLAAIFCFSACKKSDSGPSNSAKIMVINGSAGTTTIIAKANGTTIPNSSALAFGSNSGYQNVTAGSEALAFTLADGTPLISGSASATAGNNYSLFSGGLITGSSLVFISDDLSAPSQGNAKVRFINLSSDNFAASCYIGANKLDSNLLYLNYSQFIEMPAITGPVLLQNPATPTQQAEISSQIFTAGKIYTIMLTGSSAATTGSSVLTLTVINNN